MGFCEYIQKSRELHELSLRDVGPICLGPFSHSKQYAKLREPQLTWIKKFYFFRLYA